MKAKGKEVTQDVEQKLLNDIKGRYEKQTTTYYAAARLWVDAIIDPLDTRKLISEAAYYRAKHRGFEPGHELEDWIQAEAEVMGRLGAHGRAA